MTVTLKPKYALGVPVFADCISPDGFAGKSPEEISALMVWEGNKQRVLGDLFSIQGKAENPPENVAIQISGDLRKVRMIGTKMTLGKIIIEGNVGMHLGEMMTGGEINVNGNADSWAGCMMEGGRIEVSGSAGGYVGGPYRGSTKGMKGGTIVVHGDAGTEVGCYMRGGLIVVDRNVGDFVGIHMRDGTIFVRSDCSGRAGAGMLNGKIVITGCVPSILPTFTIDGLRSSTKVDGQKIPGPFYRFIGDTADNGIGKLFITKTNNQHLSFYDKYL